MIGKIYSAVTPFYDLHNNKMSYKSRPVLILAQADAQDYIVLPISTITHKEKRDAIYDIELDPCKYPALNLNKLSYVRTHKQTVVHLSSLTREISNMRFEYEDLYLEILSKRELFSQEISNQAIQ